MRRQALKTITFSLGDQRKADDLFNLPNAIDFMSSEESDDEAAEYSGRGPKPRKTKRLSWQRSKLRNIKEILDERYNAQQTKQQRRISAITRQGEEVSGRSAPTKSLGGLHDHPRTQQKSQDFRLYICIHSIWSDLFKFQLVGKTFCSFYRISIEYYRYPLVPYIRPLNPWKCMYIRLNNH